MIQAESSLGHHLFQVPIAEGIAQIPAKAEDDDLVLKVSPEKQCRPLALHSFTLPECTRRVCDRSQRIAAGCILTQKPGAEMEVLVYEKATATGEPQNEEIKTERKPCENSRVLNVLVNEVVGRFPSQFRRLR